MNVTPAVAIIGRPNVGKSTLFNRLIGRRQAIVHGQPGVTRDRITGRMEADDGRSVELVDTGGLVPGDDPLGLSEQVFLAIGESDLLLLVVDGRDGLVAADERVWHTVRRTGKPAILVVNKGDTRAARERFDEFYRLGIEHQLLLSAEHGLGIGELREVLTGLLPPEEGVPEEGEPEDGSAQMPSLAIVGRPNVGKSSLVNRLLGQPRVLVSPQAGTTRDPVDTVLRWHDRCFRLIDTAGIRRRSQVTGAPEELAVMFARRQIERAEIVILLIDAAQGVTSGDLAIAGQAWELGRGVVVAINKWDLLDEEARDRLEDSWPRLAEVLATPQRVNLSALSGRHVDRLLPAVERTLELYRTKLSTSEVNQLFELAVRRHQAPQHSGRPWKLYYATQVVTAPPTFMLFANRTLDRHDTYRRYLENRLREALELGGIPVRLVIRRR
ncbi:MAG: ribosome biogenesis GTPase Der [bacterium]|nr:ribosome biogenesis GTPase Der [bacterium]